MTRPLRRAHLILVTGLAAALVMTLPSLLARAVTGRSPSTSMATDLDVNTERVVAAATWVVGGRDTLYLAVLAPNQTGEYRGRFTASLRARWPDAVLIWQSVDTVAADGRRVLGPIAAGVSLETVIPYEEGRVHLVSRAWSEELGAWRMPLAQPGAP